MSFLLKKANLLKVSDLKHGNLERCMNNWVDNTELKVDKVQSTSRRERLLFETFIEDKIDLQIMFLNSYLSTAFCHTVSKAFFINDNIKKLSFEVCEILNHKKDQSLFLVVPPSHREESYSITQELLTKRSKRKKVDQVVPTRSLFLSKYLFSTKTLSELVFKNCSISQKTLIQFINLVVQIKSLKQLSLVSISSDVPITAMLASKLIDSNIEYLCLSNLTLTNSKVFALSRGLREMKKLQRILLEKNMLNAEGYRHVLRRLRLDKVREISFRQNAQSLAEVKVFTYVQIMKYKGKFKF